MMDHDDETLILIFAKNFSQTFIHGFHGSAIQVKVESLIGFLCHARNDELFLEKLTAIRFVKLDRRHLHKQLVIPQMKCLSGIVFVRGGRRGRWLHTFRHFKDKLRIRLYLFLFSFRL